MKEKVAVGGQECFGGAAVLILQLNAHTSRSAISGCLFIVST